MNSVQEIIDNSFKVFNPGAVISPPMTLRSGNEIDHYANPLPFDPDLDQINDQYLEQYCWGIAHLDPVSWRYYIPSLVDYALRHMVDHPGTMVIDNVLTSLRPPDRDPPRLASLTPAQEEIIVAFLDTLAFNERSTYKDYAMQVLEEYWIPNALYRKR